MTDDCSVFHCITFLRTEITDQSFVSCTHTRRVWIQWLRCNLQGRERRRNRRIITAAKWRYRSNDLCPVLTRDPWTSVKDFVIIYRDEKERKIEEWLQRPSEGTARMICILYSCETCWHLVNDFSSLNRDEKEEGGLLFYWVNFHAYYIAGEEYSWNSINQLNTSNVRKLTLKNWATLAISISDFHRKCGICVSNRFSTTRRLLLTTKHDKNASIMM